MESKFDLVVVNGNVVTASDIRYFHSDYERMLRETVANSTKYMLYWNQRWKDSSSCRLIHRR